MLRRLSLRDFVIVSALEVEFDAGLTVLTGETGAGKSILIDALQLALGSRGDAGVLREGAARAEIGAEFDAPASLLPWLEANGFDAGDGGLLLRRVIDAQGKSRAWINGSAATIGQLREAADHLLDIHGQHAWQSLTRPAAVRTLLDAEAGVDATPLAALWTAWKSADAALQGARERGADLDRERERLAWQIGELDKLAPLDGEWQELESEHRRLANMQALIDAAQTALDQVSDADSNAQALTGRAIDALAPVAEFDGRLAALVEVLEGAQAQLADASHTLAGYLHHSDVEPERLQALDDRLSAWIGLARRYRRAPEDLAGLLGQWQGELRALDAAADLAALEQASTAARKAFDTEAARTSKLRRKAAPRFAAAVTQALQQLGMAGGVFDVALVAQQPAQSFGLESAEFLVAGHAGSTPRPLAKVASGGELSRIALAVAVTSAGRAAADAASAGTLIFDEIDAGVGGAVAETVGRLMQRLGRDRQVLAVTHLPQVAACADHHFVVFKAASPDGGGVQSGVRPVAGEARVAELARMLAGERLSGTSLAHAQELLALATGPDQEAASAPSSPASGSAPSTTRGRKRA
jgi:DNA repair protein RecN (Recombination protein N)